MMVKSAQPGEVGGARPPPYTIASKVVVYAPAERADTLPLFLLYPYIYCGVLILCHAGMRKMIILRVFF
jgi:hypothetical protein